MTRGEKEVAIVVGTAGCHVPVAVVLVPESIANPELLMLYQRAANELGMETVVDELYRTGDSTEVLELIWSLSNAREAANDPDPENA